MNIKTLPITLVAMLLATPAFAHPGDHSSFSVWKGLEHLAQSPFHAAFSIGLLFLAIGVLLRVAKQAGKS